MKKILILLGLLIAGYVQAATWSAPYSVAISNQAQLVTPAVLSGITPVNAWVTNASYLAGAYVTYDGNMYVCSYPGTNATIAPTNTTGEFTNDVLITWLFVKTASNGKYGSYVESFLTNNASSYAVGDYVAYRGNTYWCKIATTNVPTDTAKWMITPISRSRVFISNNSTSTAYLWSTNSIRINAGTTYELDPMIMDEIQLYGDVNTNIIGIQEIQ
jgi:hypothetical protein